MLKFLFDPYAHYNVRLTLRLIAIIIVASLIGVAGSLFFGATGILGGLHSFFTMPVIASTVTIIFDRIVPKGRV